MPEPSPLQALIKSVNFYARFTPSFTRIGYIARGLPFRPVRADCAGQDWLVTGATGGLGRAAALGAARRGARVFAAGRNAESLSALQADASALPGSIVAVTCDLADMAEVDTLARRPELAGVDIDVLVNNVGVLMRPFVLTPEGLETSYATNLLGHYILTEGLFEEGRLAQRATIINVVSGGLYNVPLNTKMLNMAEKHYNGFAAYAAHKRAQLALADLWRQRFAARGISTYAVHPGWADTTGVKVSLPKFRKVLAPILRNAAEGADTIAWLAATRPPEAVDQVWFDRKPRSAHAYDKTRAPRATAADLVAYLDRDRATILTPTATGALEPAAEY